MEKSVIQDQALKALSSVTRGTIAMSVGTGKTLVGLKHMNSLFTEDTFFLVVAPKKSIFKSWKEDAIKFNLEYLLPHITFSTYLSLGKQDLNYTAVYLDEAHSLLRSHTDWLNNFNGNLIGLTGTPPKLNWTERGKIFNEFIPVVYTYSTDNAVKDSIINDYKIFVHYLYLGTQKNVKVGKPGSIFYTSEEANYDYWSKRIDAAKNIKSKNFMRILRMKALMSFKSKIDYVKYLLKSFDEKTIIFANTHEQADGFNVESYHSNNVNSEYNLQDFKNGKINKLACVLQLSEGVNIKDLKIGIIMHAYGNERKSEQRIGRLLRLNPDNISNVHILCYKNTIDEIWTKEALIKYDQSKITYIE